MSDTYETAWRGKIMLLKGDIAGFGRMMNENHRLLDEMMKYCGFHDGAGWANNMLIKTALDHGALGAKLTGAGNGDLYLHLLNLVMKEKSWLPGIM